MNTQNRTGLKGWYNSSGIDVMVLSKESMTIQAWRLSGIFRVKGTSPTVGKFARTGCSGHWRGRTTLLASLFSRSRERGLGKNVMILGHPLIPQQLFTFAMASESLSGHLEL